MNRANPLTLMILCATAFVGLAGCRSLSRCDVPAPDVSWEFMRVNGPSERGSAIESLAPDQAGRLQHADSFFREQQIDARTVGVAQGGEFLAGTAADGRIVVFSARLAVVGKVKPAQKAWCVTDSGSIVTFTPGRFQHEGAYGDTSVWRGSRSTPDSEIQVYQCTSGEVVTRIAHTKGQVLAIGGSHALLLTPSRQPEMLDLDSLEVTPFRCEALSDWRGEISAAFDTADAGVAILLDLGPGSSRLLVTDISGHVVSEQVLQPQPGNILYSFAAGVVCYGAPESGREKSVRIWDLQGGVCRSPAPESPQMRAIESHREHIAHISNDGQTVVSMSGGSYSPVRFHVVTYSSARMERAVNECEVDPAGGHAPTYMFLPSVLFRDTK